MSALPSPPRPFGRVWGVHAPWAHPAWHSYVVTLADLTTDTGTPPYLLAPGVTHELMVWAVNPEVNLTGSGPRMTMEELAPPASLLTPANHGYQWVAADDVEAACRVQEIVTLIRYQLLSPDTDYRRQWDALFFDGFSLLKSAQLRGKLPI